MRLLRRSSACGLVALRSVLMTSTVAPLSGKGASLAG
jgi:hypothetical protein